MNLIVPFERESDNLFVASPQKVNKNLHLRKAVPRVGNPWFRKCSIFAGSLVKDNRDRSPGQSLPCFGGEATANSGFLAFFSLNNFFGPTQLRQFL